jgi:hypothetical protein
VSEGTPESRTLFRLGLLSLAVYVVLAVFFWTNWSFKAHLIDEIVMVAAIAALAVLYFCGLKFARRAATSTIVLFAVLVGVAGFVTPPFDSTDVFFYMATGWQQSHYGANPYSGVLRNISGAGEDPMIQNEWMTRNRNPWLDIPLPYGFLFALVSRTLAWLGRGSFWATLALFGSLNLVMHAGIALLLWKASRFLPEGNGKVVLYLYTWNPFVVLQYLADLHNDILVAFLVVLAAYLLLRDRPLWSIPLLVASGLIKYITFVLVPFAFIFLVRRKGWKAGAQAILISAAMFVATALPYIGQATSFKYRLIAEQVSESSGSLHAFMVYSFRVLGRIWPSLIHFVPGFGAATKITLWAVFAVFIIRELYLSWKESSKEPLLMIQRWTSILFALIFIASSQFYAWYIGMLFPLALLTDRKSILADAIVALSGAHMLSFTFLRRKAIGYFILATVLPVMYAVLARRQRAATNINLCETAPNVVAGFSPRSGLG